MPPWAWAWGCVNAAELALYKPAGLSPPGMVQEADTIPAAAAAR